jgi:hypothetical protein
MNDTRYSPRLRFLLAFLLLAAGFSRLAFIFFLDEEQIVSYVPDDAFYYLVLAKNYALNGQWTFDGVAPTTGFHLAWAYFLSGFYIIFPDISFKYIYWICSFVSMLLYVLSGALVSIRALREFGYGAAFVTVAIFLSPQALKLPLYNMESSIVIVCAAAIIHFLGRSDPKSTFKSCLGVAIISFVGMMGRSDFGLFPATILAAHVGMIIFNRAPLRSTIAPVAALFGTIAGLIVVLLHSYDVSGSFMQASAATKAYWSEINGHDPVPSFTLVANTIAPTILGSFISNTQKNLTMFFFIVLLTLIGFREWRQNYWRICITAAMLMCILFYAVLYCFNSGSIQPWYMANLLVPSGFLLASVLQPVAQRHAKFTILLVSIWSALGLFQSLRPIWPHQNSMREAGFFLAENPGIAPVGSWNAGLISFYASRPVVNLDGLVNDEVLQHLRSGSLLEYMLERDIRYVVDFSAMFRGQEARRGGYADGRLQRCLLPEKPLVENLPGNRWANSIIQLYRFNQKCARELSHTESKLLD